MAKIVNFPLSSSGRFNLRPAKGRKKKKGLNPDQLSLFSNKPEASVIELISDEGVFEKALDTHETSPESAIKLYQKSIDLGLQVADSYCNLGILKSQMEDTVGAIDSLTKALEHEPRHFEAHYNLANVYGDSGNPGLAKLHYEIAREIDPTEPSLHYNLAVVLATIEDFSRALESLKKLF